MRLVSEVMTREVRTVAASDVVGPVRDLVLKEKINSAPVVDDAGSVVGMVTSLDLVEEWAPGQGMLTVMSDTVACGCRIFGRVR